MPIALLPRVRGSANAPADVLAELAAAVLTVGVDGEIDFSNSSADALFAPVRPVGLNLRNLLGLSGGSDDGKLADAAATGAVSAPIRIALSDGRTLDGRSRPLPSGGTVVTLLDVTCHVHTTERDATDTLTGLASRGGLNARLVELAARSQRKGSSFAVICLGLDRFKTVNDAFGNPVGDALLTRVAARLRGAARETDIVARLNEDEFAIIQSDAPQPQAAAILAKRLMDLVERSYVVSGHVVNIGAQVGIAIAPDDSEDAGKLMKYANLALHRAKSTPGGGVRFFQASMDVEMQARRLLEADLRAALALEQFELAYQPQFRLEPHALVGFEALLRWTHPTRGAVLPSAFIPLAEEVGLIVPIGAWVLRAACQEAARWPRPVSVAVNISPVQFCDNALVQTVTSALTASGLDPALLELEITEGVLLDDTDAVLRQLNALKALGVRIALDDFGTGYASMSYLQKFPFDKIKIDQSFVRGADHSAQCLAIVRAVTTLSASLGVTTIAEGVETPGQLARIKAEGCNEVQGYLTGSPLSAAGAGKLFGTAPTNPPDKPS